ncbi:MAG: hypothetical protein WAQ25_00075 [Candidatus Saccharimonas sp.]
MKKDVVYIDVDDDITAIIGKVTAAKQPIVALVPPKRVGVIQSAVNMKLVHRAAEQANKRLVIISNNHALVALASSAGIPVAKNLQSKPQLAEAPAEDSDDGNDVIDGSELPVGDHVAVAEKAASSHTDTEASEEEIVLPASLAGAEADYAPVSKSGNRVSRGERSASRVAIPNFDSFRKKLFIGIAAMALLIMGLVWALVYAPKATIVVTARTTDYALNSNVSFVTTGVTDLKAGTILSSTKTLKKDVSQSFTATGKKDVGERATGAVKFKTDAYTILVSGLTVPAGTTVTSSSGATYTTNTAAVFAKGDSSGLSGVTVAVTATAPGASYNGASGAITNLPAGVSSASFTTATSGGTDKTVAVVTQDDIDKAVTEVTKQSAVDAAKKELTQQFGADYTVLSTTFKVDSTAVKPSPALDTEAADGKAALAGSVVYTLTGAANSEISKYLDKYFAQQIDGKTNQKVYANGLKGISFTSVSQTDTGFSAAVSTNGKIGPNINEAALKEFARGKRVGEIQDYMKQIDGVDSVNVKFSPFWVFAAPNDTKRISVEFKVNGT